MLRGGTDPSVTDMMEAHALDAIDHARDRFGVMLDFSKESVSEVERMLGLLHDAIPSGFFRRMRGGRPSADDLDQMSNAEA